MRFFKLNYCSAAWTLHSRSLNDKINRLHECCLGITYHDKRFAKCNFVSVQSLISQWHSCTDYWNAQVVNGMSFEIVNDIFRLRDEKHYHWRYTTQFVIDPIHSVFNGSESASNFGPKLWEQIPTEIKNKDSLSRV